MNINVNRTSDGASVIYGLGAVGALVYYFQHAIGLGGYVFGLIKALLWPALLTYHLFDFMKM